MQTYLRRAFTFFSSLARVLRAEDYFSSVLVDNFPLNPDAGSQNVALLKINYILA